jgi:uncharacterized protein YlzI (FlbEa/FlbD family)
MVYNRGSLKELTKTKPESAMNAIRTKYSQSSSAHVRETAKISEDNNTSEELALICSSLLSKWNVGPLPFTDLCTSAEHHQRSIAIKEGRIKWRVTGWCWINSCLPSESHTCDSEDEAVNIGRNMGCYVCVNSNYNITNNRLGNGQGEIIMKKFETNETNDYGYEVVFINQQNVETVEQLAHSDITRITMISGAHHIVRGAVDQVAARLCPAIRG